MTIPEQIDRNLANAHKSTGPKTEEGKKRSSLNALKHGLAGRAISFAKIHAEAFEHRLEEWRTIYNPIDAGSEWFYHELVAESLRLEHCRLMVVDATSEFARRASTESWDRDRRSDAIDLASRLSKRPEVISAKLQATKHGCELLAEKWDSLARVLTLKGDWTDAQKSLALDLLGVEECLRSSHHLFEIGVSDEKGELLDERERFATARAAELRKRIADHYEEDDRKERESAMTGSFRSLPKPLATFQRYVKESFKRFSQLEELLSKHTGMTNDEEPRNRETRRSSKHAGLKKRKPSQEELMRRLSASFDAPDPFGAFDDSDDRRAQSDLDLAALQEIMGENAPSSALDLATSRRKAQERIREILARESDAGDDAEQATL